jgi:hypothetical protein
VTTYLNNEFAEEIVTAMQEFLLGDVESGYDQPVLELGGGVKRVETFEEVMLLTGNKGLVVKFNDGSEAQITIVAGTPGRT